MTSHDLINPQAGRATNKPHSIASLPRESNLMSQKFAFTTAAMATALEETAVSYEDLAEIEREFDDVETEISGFPFLADAARYQIFLLR